MGEYKRLISYIYSYKNGVKEDNCGFARVEERNGLCKINIVLRIGKELENALLDKYKVFFYMREKGVINKIYLDDIVLADRGGELKKRVSTDKLFGRVAKNLLSRGRNFSIENMSGIFICSERYEMEPDEEVVFASEWDDEQINVNDFRKNDDNIVLQNVDNIGYNNVNILQEAEVRVSEVKPEEALSRNNEKQEGEESRNNRRQEDEEDRNNRRFEREEDRSNRRAEREEDRNNHRSEREEERREEEQREETWQGEMWRKEELRGEMRQEEVQQGEIMQEEIEGIYGDRKGPQTGDYFKMLCGCYPKVKVDEINGECIKVTPHDISYLPKKYWHLCNNSFLLHGYYNYKYLLLCEKKINNEKKYLIGVPGLYHHKEQKVARMFGFTEFEGDKEPGVMNFGYWCMYL